MIPLKILKKIRQIEIRTNSIVAVTALAALGVGTASARDVTEWTSGSGSWTNATQWSDGLPNAFQRTEVHGVSKVIIPPGNYVAGDLEIGLEAGDRAHVELDGGKLLLLLQDSLRVGELSGGEGEFILKDGVLHCPGEVYSGAANSVPGRATKAVLRIQGGNFLARTLNVGSGWGADSLLAIEGSRASAIHVLDHCYIQAFADAVGNSGGGTLAFTLDEHGVTPITIQSRRDGLRINSDAKSHCRLQIFLSAVPPREEVTLVSSHVRTRGRFDGLPEGSEITAQFAGRTYRWRLTYRGGASGCDLMLKNRSDYAANAPVTRTRPLPEIPQPLWKEFEVYPLSAETRGEPAFPGAEGFGAFTPGGHGGKTIYVDNLNDSGPGSLREAIQTTGPRVVVFRVGGVIPLKSTLRIEEPFITIDGQNAPGAGIMLRNHGIEVRTHDVILRYFRVRVGDDNVHLDDPKARESYYGGTGEHALYFIEGSQNCIADHLSLSWSTTKVLSVTKLSDLITVQWCILSEALNFADHGYASIAGGSRVTWHHNLFAHNLSRNVRFGGLVDADFRNNVIYDWGHTCGNGEFDRVNYIGNYVKAGPSTRQKPPLFIDGEEMAMPGSLFVTNNILESEAAEPGVNQDNWRGMGYCYDRATVAAPQPFPAPPVTTESPRDAYEHVLKNAGATLPRRDAVDERIVNETRNGTGHIIKWVKDVGGWPVFPSATALPKEGDNK
jgi:pectate lyase